MRAFSVAGGEPLGQLEQALLHRLQQLLRALSLGEAKSGRGWNGRATVKVSDQPPRPADWRTTDVAVQRSWSLHLPSLASRQRAVQFGLRLLLALSTLESTRACPHCCGSSAQRWRLHPLEVAARNWARRRRFSRRGRAHTHQAHIPLASCLQQLPSPLPPAPASLAMLSESAAPGAHPPPSSGPSGTVPRLEQETLHV